MRRAPTDGANLGLSLSADCELLAQNRSHYVSPSDHAQFMAFWATYGALFLLCYVPSLGRWGWRPALAAAMPTLALAVAASRVYLQYHTRAQVVAGLLNLTCVT